MFECPFNSIDFESELRYFISISSFLIMCCCLREVRTPAKSAWKLMWMLLHLQW